MKKKNVILKNIVFSDWFIVENYIKLMRFHYEEGLKIGIDDLYYKEYNIEKFYKEHSDNEDFILITVDNENVGFLSINTNYYDESIIVLTSLHILEKHQRNGYATEAIKELKKATGKTKVPSSLQERQEP